MAVNYIAVLIAALAYIIVGILWYGPLFGKHWMSLVGFTEKDAKKMKNKKMGAIFGLTFLSGLVTAYALGFTLAYLEVRSIILAFQVAFWLWLAFAAMVQLPHYLQEKKSIKLYLITVGYELVYFLAMALVFAVW